MKAKAEVSMIREELYLYDCINHWHYLGGYFAYGSCCNWVYTNSKSLVTYILVGGSYGTERRHI